MNIYYLSWQEFDEIIATIKKPVCDGFYPIPRGGLVVATVLSHQFNKPILAKPTHLSIYVDDIADSGKTLRDLRLKHDAPAIVLLKRHSCDLRALTFGKEIPNDDWIVFPWENKQKAIDDYTSYISRK